MSQIAAVLEKFSDASVKSSLQEEAYRSIRPELNAARHVNPYSIDTSAANKLESLGIITNPFSIRLHTHAACKVIENKLLEVVGRVLPQERVTMLFLKKSKLDMMRRNKNLKDIFINQHLEPRDISRYGPEHIYNSIPFIPTQTAYISDTLHFWKSEQLLDLFYRNPLLETLYATIVLPVEAMHRHPSRNPEIYHINYSYNGFQYIPGSHGGGAYHHEFSSLDWLSMGYIYTPNLEVEITAQMIESLGANHLFVFRRGKLLTPRVRTFSTDEYVIFPKIFSNGGINHSHPVKKELAMKLFMYTKSVNKAEVKDLFAKIRQLLDAESLTSFQPEQITTMANYFYFIGQLDATNHNRDALSGGIIRKMIITPYLDILDKVIEKLNGPKDYRKLIQALHWTEFTYSLEISSKKIAIPFNNEMAEMIDELIDDELSENIINPNLERIKLDDKTQDALDEIKEEMIPSFERDQSSKILDQTQLWQGWKPLLKKLGYEGDQEQYDSNKELILPITEMNTTVINSYKTHPHEFENVPYQFILELKKINRFPTRVSINSQRASCYASDLKNGRTGALASSSNFQEWRNSLSLKCELDDMFFNMVVIHGAGGSGKSKFIQDYMNTLPSDCNQFLVVVPTNELRLDWETKVPKLQRHCFKTFEKAITQGAAPVVVFDDYTKLPNGYIEAFLLSHTFVQLAVLTGDSRQSTFHEINDQAMINSLKEAVEHFKPHCTYYLNCTHRNRKDLANSLGVYSEKEGKTVISIDSKFLPGIPVLTPSLTKKETLADMGHRSLTYAGCQGLTAPKVQILLDTNTPLCSERVMYTALSRAVDEIHFINTGPNSGDFWNKLDCTPYLKTFLSTVREKQLPIPEAQEPKLKEPVKPVTHIPAENALVILETKIDAQGEKFNREIFSSKTGYSNCIQTEDPVVQLFQHQQAKDQTLFETTVDYRLTKSSKLENEAEFLLKKDLGDILFLNYAKAMGLPTETVPFNLELWQTCAAEVQNKYLSKPLAQLINSQLRQSPDFKANKIMIFLKSQWVKKIEKLGALKIKPGQTIAAFMQETVMLYGTMARYMRKLREKFQPSDIYIHCEKDITDMSEYCKKHWNFNGPAFANDYTAFDQSQDGAMLQFEILKAKHFNIPEDILEGYINIKLNSETFLGTLSIMRLTGEGPTFDANTECAIAYHFTKHFHRPGNAHLFAGDDSAISYKPTVKPSFARLASKFTLVSKPEEFSQTKGDYAKFCGNTITPYGVVKEPLKLFASLELAKRTGKMRETSLAYAHDIKHLYGLGDHIYDILTENELIYHQNVIRTLILQGHADVIEGLSNQDIIEIKTEEQEEIKKLKRDSQRLDELTKYEQLRIKNEHRFPDNFHPPAHSLKYRAILRELPDVD
uniref:RNA replication protein n=1 Tax=Dioscorea potexvirus 1 TaxID=2794413 RepID=A0A7T5QZ42_9VIRU|nr:RdRp [Dioscorea potexvirus 1]